EIAMSVSRPNYLAATGSALVEASALSSRAGATDDKNNGDALCGHGLVGNRGLAGIAGALNLAFTLRVVRLLAFAVVFSPLASTFVFGEARFSGEIGRAACRD